MGEREQAGRKDQRSAQELVIAAEPSRSDRRSHSPRADAAELLLSASVELLEVKGQPPSQHSKAPQAP